MFCCKLFCLLDQLRLLSGQARQATGGSQPTPKSVKIFINNIGFCFLQTVFETSFVLRFFIYLQSDDIKRIDTLKSDDNYLSGRLLINVQKIFCQIKLFVVLNCKYFFLLNILLNDISGGKYFTYCT